MFVFYIIPYFNFSKDGKNKTKTAKSSNLPSSIAKERIHFETSGNLLQFPLGPINSPKPGPTFEIALLHQTKSRLGQ